MGSLRKSHPHKKVGSFSWWKMVKTSNPVTARPYSSDAARMTKWLRRLEPRRSPQDVAKLGRDNVPGHASFFGQNSSLGSSPKPQRLSFRILQVHNELHVLKEYLAPTLFLLETQDSHMCDHPGIACLQFLNSCNIMQCYWASGQPVWLLKSRYSVKAGWKRAPEAKGLN